MTFLLLVLVLSQGAPTVTRALPSPVDPQVDRGAFADAEPDVVLRGTSTTIVVAGSDADALKTLQVDPPNGVRLSGIKALPARPDGSSAIEVIVTVDGSAEPGERSLVLTAPPTMSVSSAGRPGADPMTKQMELAFQEIMKRETKPTPLGTLYINAHDIRITQVRIQGRQVAIIVVDPVGDIVAEPMSSAIPIGGGATAAIDIRQMGGPIESEARCAGETIDSPVNATGTIGKRSDAAGAVQVSGELDLAALTGACELRIRVRDKDGNISPWYSTTVQGR